MAVQIVMDHTGDTRHRFDPADARAVAQAEARFKELTGAGFTAAKRLGDGKSEVVRSFDPTVEETLFIPRLRGGYNVVAGVTVSVRLQSRTAPSALRRGNSDAG
jgi:hypothetical protein